MNIGIVTYAGCIRCIKECRMLAEQGHKLFLFSYHQPNVPKDIDPNELFFHQTGYKNPQMLLELLQGLDFLDIIHVHNEPSWMVNIARQAGHKKIVLDAHDLNIVRYGWDKALEINGGEDVKAVGECDGLIVPCDRYIDIIEEKVKLIIPTMTLYSYVNKDDFVDLATPIDMLGGIVYQGNIFQPAPNHPLPYRIYDKVAKQIISMNIPFYIYPSRGLEQQLPFYQALGCKVMNNQDPKDLLKSLSRHRWGFCGSPIPHRQWDHTMSNKLFDYIAAGIPPIVFNADASEQFVRKHKIGPIISSIDEIEHFYNDLELRAGFVKNIIELRDQFTMESQYQGLEKFYEQVLSS